MPDAENAGDAQDDSFQTILDQAVGGTLDVGLDRDLDTGEKAPDAYDFEDISDTDLAAEEDDPIADHHGQRVKIAETDSVTHPGQDPGPVDAAGLYNSDDLFEEDGLQSLGVEQSAHRNLIEGVTRLFRSTDKQTRADETDETSQLASKEEQLQQELFARSRASVATDMQYPEPPESSEELLKALWPKFQKNAIPRFMELLPPNKARYLPRPVPKPPRALHPTKVSLNLNPDYEKSFKTTSENYKRSWQEMSQPGVVPIASNASMEERSEHDSGDEVEDDEADAEHISHLDMQVLCENWDLLDETDGIEETTKNLGTFPWPQLPQSFREPEVLTERVSKKIKLDLNDPCLLLDDAFPACLPNLRKESVQSFRPRPHKYNISNDEEYDLLKENHQHKIRGMLGHLQIDHAMPALRLQWPFYKTRLEKQQARSFHRPSLIISRQEQISFSKPGFTKKKYQKAKDVQELFSRSSDLSLIDNSNALFLEYSEEHPMVLSNLGMGNKVVNHYRKKFTEDSFRPKMDLGELNPLLPNDKSPFSMFGFVDSGQVVSAVQNAMYQAPIFRQEPNKTDFLIVKTTTGVHGPHWYLRNIENLYVVGQEFPLVEIPGPNSRKVSTAAKNRLKMIAYRLARRNKNNHVSLSAVTEHFPETTDVQNRQKMKDFMQFDKAEKEWKPKPGESIPDEELVRNMVKSEEVCLLESMQAGEQHLLDAGVVKLGEEIGAENDTQDNDHIETKLAPWFASKHFLQSTQGKAMLQLHGEGDPSGRGEAISMVKTSMKGGFKSQGSSASERIEDKKDKEKGHTYNVQRQTQAYEESIRRIWDAQMQSLASNIEQSDSDASDEIGEALDQTSSAPFTRSEVRSQGAGRRLDDESASQSSRWSTNSQTGKMLEITRTVRDSWGGQETVRDIIKNPRIIRQYIRRRNALQVGSEDVAEMTAGSDAAENKRMEQKLQMELARLNRNKDRRIARDKQKGIFTDGTTDPDGSPDSPSVSQARTGSTLRKCANCGQTGHIKTNKKLCPLLNGKMDPDDGFNSNSFTSSAPT